MKLSQLPVGFYPPPKRFSEAAFNLKRADDVRNITRGLSAHCPLTVRSIYYKVISSPIYLEDHWRTHDRWGNCLGKNLSKPVDEVGDCLKYLRLEGGLPMHSINDDSRIVTLKRGVGDFSGHVTNSLDAMEIPYFDRCNAADQEDYIEVWIEKNGLVHIAETVADDFCRRTVGCKGFTSVSLLAGYAGRANNNPGGNIILYFGDCDPSRWLIPKTIKSCLEYEHDLDVEVKL